MKLNIKKTMQDYTLKSVACLHSFFGDRNATPRGRSFNQHFCIINKKYIVVFSLIFITAQ